MGLFDNLNEDQINSIVLGGELLASDDASVGKFIAAASVLSRNPKVRTTLALGAMAYTVGGFAYKKYREHANRKTYMIKIYQNDPMYDIIQEWLIESLQEADQRNVVAFSIKANKRYGALDNYFQTGRVEIAYDGSRTQPVVIDGHTVMVQTSAESRGNSHDSASGSVGGSKRYDSMAINYLQIECRSIAARRAVLARLREESAKQNVRPPRFRIAQRWGDFASVSDIPTRPIESVILKRGQAERVIEDLKTFLSQEEKYTELGIPYRRGLLLSGPPGTGKTSLASAITHELGLEVYYIALSALESDSTLSELLSNIDPRSVLLLEDVDVVHAAKERDDEENGVTMAGLLNALDGFITPHGLITIMTTNHIEVLDPALIRPGRIDMIETIGAIDHDQLVRMCQQYLGYVPDGLPEVDESDNIMPSEIIEVFKKTIATDDKREVGSLLVEVLHRRRDTGISISDSLAVNDLIESV